MNAVFLTTLGCPKNMVDSRHLIESLESEGFISVDDPKYADIILVNTCGFIKDAKQESINEILKLLQYKIDGNKSRKLLVFGCLAQRYRKELMKEIPEIDGIWGVGQEEEILAHCRDASNVQELRQAASMKLLEIKKIRQKAPRQSFAYLKIADGCDRKCTFCVIPSIRGKFKSIAYETILNEAQAHVQSGVKELILVAQDILNYGREWKGYGLAELLKDLVAIKGDFRIRLLYLYPTEVTDSLLDVIARESKICKYLDIPLQHSEDRLLRLMGRRGTRKEYTKLIRTIRRVIPGVTLRTTFIVGFPSETEEDFRELVDFIEEMRFERLGAFMFSKEEGTPSARLKGQLPERIKRHRFDEIMRRQSSISLEANRELVSKRFTVLIDEMDDRVAIARMCSQSPEIDGVTIIENAIEQNKRSLKIGEFVNVEIVEAYDYDVKGRLM
ncbi:MAG TPA: 30S ribosomal protein S12 methylthiotransferase RimO [Dissulfurispiraceae bacterium]|nr:30S ribosomal protein S12 methylthiotransferase RimO [Dissulfurispiraceae bacterium]